MTDFQFEKLVKELRDLNYSLKRVTDSVNNVSTVIGWIFLVSLVYYWLSIK